MACFSCFVRCQMVSLNAFVAQGARQLSTRAAWRSHHAAAFRPHVPAVWPALERRREWERTVANAVAQEVDTSLNGIRRRAFELSSRLEDALKVRGSRRSRHNVSCGARGMRSG